MRDIVVDKEKGRVWARVGVKNCKSSFLFLLLGRGGGNLLSSLLERAVG